MDENPLINRMAMAIHETWLDFNTGCFPSRQQVRLMAEAALRKAQAGGYEVRKTVPSGAHAPDSSE